MSVAANRYAKALMDVLYPDNAEAGFEQLQRFARVLRDVPDAARILENPTISADRRKALVTEITKTLTVHAAVRNFLDLLVERDRLNLINEIIPAYERLMDDRLGVVRANVMSARQLDDAERQQLTEKLQKVTGKKVRMEIAVDPALIGGVVARIGGTIYDGSLRRQLQSFKQRLIEE